jgi:lipid II:glycine glycyltransferase (peptidoglycan interpeptide bridge formation enzyme)
MKIRLEPKKLRALLPSDILFQTTFWGRVKSRLGCDVLAFDIEAAGPWGDLLVFIQSHGNNGAVAYVPQGPEIAPDTESYGAFLEALSEAMLVHMDPKVVCIRYDLPWESQYAGEIREQHWQGYPEARLREMRMNFGTQSWNLKKATVDMTVASSLIVDLEGSEARLLACMKSKTRYNIGLARRKGVAVSLAAVDQLPAFYALYRQTAKRNGFAGCDYRHFAVMFETLVRDPGASEILFLLAHRRHDLLAGAIVAISGRRAYYLYGASANENRNLMGPYALHWSAMQYARAHGCVEYDMGAVSPGMNPEHPFYGLYRFKTGFGGRLDLRSGSWDYPLREAEYTAFRNAESMSCGQGV